MIFKNTFLFFIISVVNVSYFYAQDLHLSVVGKTMQETKILDSLGYKKDFSDFEAVQKQINALKYELNALGFIDHLLTDLKSKENNTYLATFDLQKRYSYIYLNIDKSLQPEIEPLLSFPIKDSKVKIPIHTLEKTLEHLNTQLSEKSDPFLSLTLEYIKKDSLNNLSANLKIVKNKQRHIDSIIIRGYDKFPKSYVKHFLKIKKGQKFQLQTIQQKTEKLNDLSFANQIKAPELLFTKDSTHLYIYVEKQTTNTFDGFLGFGTNDESSKLEFNGYLNLNLINNLNYGETFSLLYKGEDSDRQTFEVATRLPYILGTPIGLELGLQIFKKDSSYASTSQHINTIYPLTARSQVSLGVSAQSSTNLLENTTSLIQDYKSNFYQAAYHYEKKQRFDPLFPIELMFNLSLGVGNRKSENLNVDQTKVELNAYKIIKLNDRNSFYIKINGASLHSTLYFENELFRFGGINSIRGFEENSLLANLYGVINTEYRYRLSNELYIHSIIDAAYLENDLNAAKTKLLGFGFGFGLLTKAGLFKLNYSNGKDENSKFKLSESKVHLSLSSTF